MNANVMKIPAYIGAFGPILLFLLVFVTIFLRGLDNLSVILLLAWTLISMVLNSMLKMIFNQARPKNSIHLNNVEKYFDNGTSGMPSGHAQFVGTQLAMSVCLGLPLWIIVYAVFQSGISLWQRYAYKKHTIEQLFAGFCIGIVYSSVICSVLKPHILKNRTSIRYRDQLQDDSLITAPEYSSQSAKVKNT